MPDVVKLKVNGLNVTMPSGSMVSAAVFAAGMLTFRRSIKGERRGPLCGMGICFECVARINGQAKSRTCQVLCENDMDVETDE